MAEMVKAKFSTNFEAIRSRIRRLPTLVKGAIDGQIKRDLDNTIDEYKKGLKLNNFRLRPLNTFTEDKKASDGLVRASSPLYGDGESQKNSLYNALAIRRIKNGYRLYRRRAKHHSADLPLNVLLSIHENGAIIRVTDNMRGFLHFIGLHLKASTMMIRIPPRPVVDKAIQRMLRKKKKGEPGISVKKAINTLIKTGKENELNKIAEYEAKNEIID